MSTLDGTFQGTGSIAGTTKLTPDSIQEALRIYFQPIKNDDPQLDFYTMYKRETVEYDTEYMQKYNEDLNTTLIFVRFRVPHYHIALTTFSGRFVLGSQLRLRHRYPIQARARPHRTFRGLPPGDPPHPQSIRHSRRRPYRTPSVEWSPCGDYRDLRPAVCKPSDVPVGRIRRNVGKAMAEPLPPTRRGIGG